MVVIPDFGRFAGQRVEMESQAARTLIAAGRAIDAYPPDDPSGVGLVVPPLGRLNPFLERCIEFKDQDSSKPAKKGKK